MKGLPKVYKRSEIFPEPEWEALVEELFNHKGTVFLMGATSSGKSTLARYLIEKLLSKDTVISLIDSDIGQSSLGVPGTINIKIFKTAMDIKNFVTEKIFFIGSLNPAKKISLMIEGSKKLVDIARAKSEIVLVDSTGLINGEAAKAFIDRHLGWLSLAFVILLVGGFWIVGRKARSVSRSSAD